MFGFSIDARGHRYSKVFLVGVGPAWILGPRRGVGHFLTEDPSGRRPHLSGLFEIDD